jgi:hypothetical protein
MHPMLFISVHPNTSKIDPWWSFKLRNLSCRVIGLFFSNKQKVFAGSKFIKNQAERQCKAIEPLQPHLDPISAFIACNSKPKEVSGSQAIHKDLESENNNK